MRLFLFALMAASAEMALYGQEHRVKRWNPMHHHVHHFSGSGAHANANQYNCVEEGINILGLPLTNFNCDVSVNHADSSSDAEYYHEEDGMPMGGGMGPMGPMGYSQASAYTNGYHGYPNSGYGIHPNSPLMGYNNYYTSHYMG